MYSFYTGVRYGFRFPRLLHLMAATISLGELLVLVVWPIRLSAIGLLLGSLLVILPFAPYIGWTFAGGPDRVTEHRSNLRRLRLPK
jgi:hypothetical protein